MKLHIFKYYNFISNILLGNQSNDFITIFLILFFIIFKYF